MATLNGGRGWASDACAASVHRLDSAFGRILPIASAGRSWDEQNAAYQRYKRGQGPLALPPGTSVHEKGNAIDWGNAVYSLLRLYDGLGNRGTTLNSHGHRRTVSSEVWHTEYFANEDQHRGGGSGGSGAPSIRAVQTWLNDNLGAGLAVDGQDGPKTQAAVKRYQAILGVTQDGVWGPKTQAAHEKAYPANHLYGNAWVRVIQDKLNRLNYGPLTVDGLDGPITRAAVIKFQRDNGLQADGVAGPVTNAKMDDKLTAAPVGRNASGRSTYDLQRKLIEKGYDLGQFGADGDYGPATTAAVIKFQKDNGLEPDGIYGPATDDALFKSAPTQPQPTQPGDTTQWPTNGRNVTTRPTKDIQAKVGMPAADQDGAYGPKTSVAVAKWQKANGLDADGIWGPASDLKGFPGVPLPDAPADPTKDPLYGKKKPIYPGATWADVSPNKSVREGDVKLFIIHHRADTGTAASARKRFMTANDRNVSPNWNVNQDGTVDEIVPPDDYRAWTTGAVDHQAVTVETGNTSGDPAWGISPESHEAIANIVAWWSHHYALPIQRGSVSLDANGKNVVHTPGVVGHRDTPAGKSTGTACPGPSMNIDWIIARANVIYQEKYVQTPPPVEEPGTPVLPAEIRALLEQLRANELANAEEIEKYLA